jgi:hypothetical protein
MFIFLSHTGRYCLPVELQSESESIVPTAAPAVVAGENRLIAIDRGCPDRAVFQAVVKRIHLIIHALRKKCVLTCLRLTENSLIQLILKIDNPIILCIDLRFYAVQFELTQLIEDRLCISRLALYNIPCVVCIGKTCCIALVLDNVLGLASSKPVVTAIMLPYRLFILYFSWFPHEFRLYLHPLLRVGVGHSCQDYWITVLTC